MVGNGEGGLGNKYVGCAIVSNVVFNAPIYPGWRYCIT